MVIQYHLDCSEEEVNKLLRNIDTYAPIYTVSYFVLLFELPEEERSKTF
jgi:hypothetical protein